MFDGHGASPIGGSKLFLLRLERRKNSNHARVASGDVGSQFFEQADRTGAAPVIDRLGDIDALSAGIESRPATRRVPQEITDMVDDPVVAAFDQAGPATPVDAAAVTAAWAPMRLTISRAVRVGRGNRALIERAVDLRYDLPQLGGVIIGVTVIRHG